MLEQAVHGIEKISKQLDIEFSYSTANHNFELGLPLENSLKNYFKKYFPKKCEFTSGYLVDKDGKVSNQIDWIIYNCLDFTPLIAKSNIEDTVEWIPFDSVYSSVEVKRTLDEDTLNKAIIQISKSKQLQRAKTTLLQVNPLLEIPLKFLNIEPNSAGLKKICNYYYFGIYAYSTTIYDDPNVILDELIKYKKDYSFDLMPDFIAIHGKYYVRKMLNTEKDISATPFINETNSYGIIKSNENTSGIFFTDLITQISNTKLSAFYLMNYAPNIIRYKNLINIAGKYY
jgi:hypothetical protein